jgi:hypothetical protein
MCLVVGNAAADTAALQADSCRREDHGSFAAPPNCRSSWVCSLPHACTPNPGQWTGRHWVRNRDRFRAPQSQARLPSPSACAPLWGGKKPLGGKSQRGSFRACHSISQAFRSCQRISDQFRGSPRHGRSCQIFFEIPDSGCFCVRPPSEFPCGGAGLDTSPVVLVGLGMEVDKGTGRVAQPARKPLTRGQRLV